MNQKIKNYPIPLLLFILISCFGGCKEHFYPPKLTPKLCIIGVLDIDDTTNFYITPPSKYMYNRNFGKSFFLEKSFQKVYPEDIDSSIIDLTCSISSGYRELFHFKGDKNLKSPMRIDIPFDIPFNAIDKIHFEAQESNNKISADATTPHSPPKLNLISCDKGYIALKEPIDGWPLSDVDTIKTGIVNFEFNNELRDAHYAIILYCRFISLPLRNLYTFLNFSIMNSNAAGFFSEIYGLTGFKTPLTKEGLIGHEEMPICAYFIDAKNIGEGQCRICLSTQFNGAYSSYRNPFIDTQDRYTYSQIVVKLLSISPEYYNLEKSLYQYGKVKNDPFSEPVFVNGNIKGGNGIFTICRSTQLRINLNPPY